MRPSAESPRARGRRREPQRAPQRKPERDPGIRKSPRGLRGNLVFLITGGGCN